MVFLFFLGIRLACPNGSARFRDQPVKRRVMRAVSSSNGIRLCRFMLRVQNPSKPYFLPLDASVSSQINNIQ
jgi:hypothetical protein